MNAIIRQLCWEKEFNLKQENEKWKPFTKVRPDTHKAIIPQLKNTLAEKPEWFTRKTSMEEKKEYGIIHVHWNLGIVENYCGE